MTRSHQRVVVPMTLLLFAATAGRAALAAPCDSAYVRVHHKIVMVLPSGGDDTANLQCAIDQATARGRGAIVQLFPGTYQTQQLLITALRGTLRGAGRRQTVLRNPDFPLPIDNASPWEVGPPAPTNRYPVMLSVIGGDVTISDLSLSIVGSRPSQDWYWLGFGPLNFIDPALFVYGSHTVVRAERIGISGASACFPQPDTNLLVAVSFWNYESSTMPWVSSSELSVIDSVLQACATAVVASQLIDSPVTVSRNTIITRRVGVLVDALIRSRVEVSHNDFAQSRDPADGAAGVIVGPSDFGDGVIDATFLIRNNRFGGTSGVVLQENFVTPEGGDPIFFGDINCAMFGNNVDHTTTGYLLQAGTRDCTIVVHGGDTVVDETNGAHTIIRRGR